MLQHGAFVQEVFPHHYHAEQDQAFFRGEREGSQKTASELKKNFLSLQHSPTQGGHEMTFDERNEVFAPCSIST